MSTPIIIAQRWLAAQLADDPVLQALLPGGVWLDDAQAAAPSVLYPRCRVSLATPSDLFGVGATIVWTQLDYDIVTVIRGQSYEPLGPAVARIHAQLHTRAGDVAGGTVRGCYRVNPLGYAELATGGVPFRHLGGTYRLYVQVT